MPASMRNAIDAERHMLLGATLPEGLGDALAAELRHAFSTAFVSGYRAIMLLAAVLALASAFTAWWVFRQRAQ